jgi:hypothetical protein
MLRPSRSWYPSPRPRSHVPCQPQAAPMRLVAAVRLRFRESRCSSAGSKSRSAVSKDSRPAVGEAVGPGSGLCMARQKIMSQSTAWMENIVDCHLLVAQGQRLHCRAIGAHDRIFH